MVIRSYSFIWFSSALEESEGKNRKSQEDNFLDNEMTKH